MHKKGICKIDVFRNVFKSGNGEILSNLCTLAFIGLPVYWSNACSVFGLFFVQTKCIRGIIAWITHVNTIISRKMGIKLAHAYVAKKLQHFFFEENNWCLLSSVLDLEDIKISPAFDLFGKEAIEREWVSLEDLTVS